MTATLFDFLSPRGERLWSWLRHHAVLLAELLLNSRIFLHSLLVLHLGCETVKMAEPGNLFLADPRQYHWLIATGGEAFWGAFLGCGAVCGLVGLLSPRRLARSLSALVLAVVEGSFVHFLTMSGAAPTAGPTYDVLVLAANWLVFAHWLPRWRVGR